MINQPRSPGRHFTDAARAAGLEARRRKARPVVTEARQALAGLEATAWNGQVTNRAAFAHALASGQAVHEFEPSSPAATEMRQLWEAVRSALGEAPAVKKKGRRK